MYVIAREGLSSMIALVKVDLTVQNDKYLLCDENCTGPDSMHCGQPEICKRTLMLLDRTRAEQSIGMHCTLKKQCASIKTFQQSIFASP